GLRHYLKKHRYKNTVTENLWESLQTVSKKPVKQIMKNWTQKEGYPIISVIKQGSSLNIKQQRFFSSPLSEKSSKDQTTWSVPVHIQTNYGTKKHLIDQKNTKINLPPASSWIKINANEVGFFRTSYLPEMLAQLKNPISKKQLPAIDRLGIIRDAFALAEAG